MSAPSTARPVSDEVARAALAAWARAGSTITLPVEGDSMWPLLQAGDQVVIAPGRAPLRMGQPLAYRSAGRVVIHRLLRQQDADVLIVGGDNRPHADPPVSCEAVIGPAVAVRTPAGAFSLESGRARWLGRGLALCRPLRAWWGLRRAARLFARLAARLLRP